MFTGYYISFQVDGLLTHSDWRMVIKLNCTKDGIVRRNKKIVMPQIL